MAEEVKNRCSGDCKQCLPWQRMYCSSQLAYTNMKMLEFVQGEIMSLKQDIRMLNENYAHENDLFNPKEQGEAQNVEAVQTIGSQDN